MEACEDLCSALDYTQLHEQQFSPETVLHPHERRTLDRLDLGARRRGEAKSRTAERLIDEGLRMEDHPGIVFKEGPAGRRAALSFGPDVWQIVTVFKEMGLADERAIAAITEWGNLSHAQVNVALRYYADFPEEVDERITYNREEWRTAIRRVEAHTSKRSPEP